MSEFKRTNYEDVLKANEFVNLGELHKIPASQGEGIKTERSHHA